MVYIILSWNMHFMACKYKSYKQLLELGIPNEHIDFYIDTRNDLEWLKPPLIKHSYNCTSKNPISASSVNSFILRCCKTVTIFGGFNNSMSLFVEIHVIIRNILFQSLIMNKIIWNKLIYCFYIFTASMR